MNSRMTRRLAATITVKIKIAFMLNRDVDCFLYAAQMSQMAKENQSAIASNVMAVSGELLSMLPRSLNQLFDRPYVVTQPAGHLRLLPCPQYSDPPSSNQNRTYQKSTRPVGAR